MSHSTRGLEIRTHHDPNGGPDTVWLTNAYFREGFVTLSVIEGRDGAAETLLAPHDAVQLAAGLLREVDRLMSGRDARGSEW